MKTIAVTFELIVRMALFGAVLTMIVLQARDQRKLAYARARSGR